MGIGVLIGAGPAVPVPVNPGAGPLPNVMGAGPAAGLLDAEQPVTSRSATTDIAAAETTAR
jgi:hypothetical protein